MPERADREADSERHPGSEAVRSLWAATRGTPGAYAPLDGDAETDILVVGGGYTGLSCALHAAENGASVRLIEAETIGYGASGRNGGQVLPDLRIGLEQLIARFGEDHGRALFAFAGGAPDFLADLVRRKNLECDFVRPGTLKLAHSKRTRRALESAHQGLIGAGMEARLLSRTDLQHIAGTARYECGLLDPRGGNLHPLRFAQELARATVAAGATLHERTRAVGLSSAHGRWTVRTGRGTVTAKRVVVATNGYTDELLPGLGNTVLPVNSFQVATAPMPDHVSATVLPGGHAAIDTRRLILYFRKDPSGRFILGGRASFSSATGQGGKRDYEVLRKVMIDVFPQLESMPIEYSWTGLVAITRDFVPHYHQPESGLHVLVGMNGRGVAMSVQSGAMLADLMLGRGRPQIPDTPIAPIPLHALRVPVLNGLMQCNRVLDAVGL